MAPANALLRALIAAGVLLTTGTASGQQASFAVSVRLHAAAKPPAAEQLCPGAQPMEVLGVHIRIDCPAPAHRELKTSQASSDPGARKRVAPPHVTVTY